MFHPIGDLPPSVYWRRRALAAAVAVVAVILLWSALSAAGGSGSNQPADAAAVGTLRTPSGSAVGPVPSSAASGASSSGAVPSGSGTPSSGAASSSAPASSAPASSAPASSGAATKPGNCPDKAILLRVVPAAKSYRIGDTPKFLITVQNGGTVACVRDLDAAKQEVLLYAGSTRLWSSNDCYPASSKDVRTLAPKQTVQFEVTWSGLSSEPTCAQPRTQVPAGTYTLRAKLATLTSPDATLVLTN